MDENPYQPPFSEESSSPTFAPTQASSSKTAMKVYGLPTCMILGAAAATFGAFPVASLVALVYRFPVPFRGYASGFGAIVPANFAVLVYGVMGGFIVLPFSGAVAAALTHWAARLTGGTGQSGSLLDSRFRAHRRLDGRCRYGGAR
jgi:hypothetical protein